MLHILLGGKRNIYFPRQHSTSLLLHYMDPRIFQTQPQLKLFPLRVSCIIMPQELLCRRRRYIFVHSLNLYIRSRKTNARHRLGTFQDYSVWSPFPITAACTALQSPPPPAGIHCNAARNCRRVKLMLQVLLLLPLLHTLFWRRVTLPAATTHEAGTKTLAHTLIGVFSGED